MASTKIQWADKVWNPVTGCTKVSEGCLNCYAEIWSNRLRHIPAARGKYRNGFRPMVHQKELAIPYGWKKPCKIFTCSMGDLFHEAIPFTFIAFVMAVIRDCTRHHFMILTKRPERMREFFTEYMPVLHNFYVSKLKNLSLGVTTENQARANERIPILLSIPCTSRFISCEPLLGPISLQGFDINLIETCGKKLGDLLHLVIAGGENGHGARKPKLYHFVDLIMECNFLKIPFFFKGFGKYGSDLHMELLLKDLTI